MLAAVSATSLLIGKGVSFLVLAAATPAGLVRLARLRPAVTSSA